MAEAPITPDKEQQHADNVASRKQSGLEPQPQDREAQERQARENDPTDERGSAREGREQAED